MPEITGFKGLNNRLDPTALGLQWQLQADNALCDDAGYLCRRPGWVAETLGLRDVFATRNGRLLAITINDALVEFDATGRSTLLFEGITGGPFLWAELGYAFFVQSVTAQWAIYPDRIIPWGSLVSNPTEDATTVPVDETDGGLLGMVSPVITTPYYPPPLGDCIGVRRNQIVISVWEPAKDRSVLYFSRPDFPHHFELDRGFQLVPGRVNLLAGVAGGFVIGTDRSIYIDTNNASIQRVADYGVPRDAMVYDDRSLVWFWSQRGLCRAIPFENLTDAALVPTVRERGTAALLPWQGSVYFVFHQTGAIDSHAVARPYTPLSII